MNRIISLFIALVLTVSCFFAGTVQVFAGTGTEIAQERFNSNKTGFAVVEKNGVASTISGGKIAVFGAGKNTSDKSNIFADSTVFGEEKIFVNYSTTTNSNLTQGPRMQISAGSVNSGKLIFETEFYMACASDGAYFNVGIRCDGRKAQDDKIIYSPTNNPYGISPYNLYNIKIEIDFEKTDNNYSITVSGDDTSVTKTYTLASSIESADHIRLVGTPISDTHGSDVPENMKDTKAFYAFGNMKMYYLAGYSKAAITQIASDGVSNHSTNELSFKISNNIEGLSKEHISVKSSSGTIIGVTDFTCTQDGEGYLVNVTLEANLAPWSDYTLVISADAYDGYLEYINNEFYDVSEITGDFYTPSVPFDLKDPIFTCTSDGIKARALCVNTSGTPRNVSFVFSAFNDGVNTNITSKTYPQFEASYPGTELSNEVSVSVDTIARFFVIGGWDNPVPLFGKSWTVDGNGELISGGSCSAVQDNTISGLSCGEFNYDSKKILLSFSDGTEQSTNATLVVKKHGETLSDTNLPIYIDCITTAADGSFEKEILFGNDFSYGKYEAMLYMADSAGAYSCEFDYYTPQELLDIQRQGIYDDAKSAPTSGVLMQVIKGLNPDDEVINTNFEVFTADVDISVYNKLKNKDNVYAIMFKKLQSLNSYSDLCTAFEAAASEEYRLENASMSAPSSNNKNYGSSSSAMKETVSTPAVVPDNTENDADTQVEKAMFSDMSDHWAMKSAEDLSKRGIINGYEDGSFRPDNNVTRAEMAKILVEAFSSSSGYTGEFTDVSKSDWYADYVAGAKKNGIITGFENGSFSPESFITRQDAVLMLYRAILLVKEVPAGYTLFIDDFEIAPYACDATRALGELGIINGTPEGEFKPLNNMTRAELAVLVCRAFDYVESH